ncbi:MAG: type II toxin-antitoxin system RelE/ParE family toxin [Candidatus Thiodiazotropha endolucinida]|uniref:Type II toxin-antitoxin system RelE/ParE family toxin n=1 Tax=Candidatus Thiodiazotropha taylori TaxID=2792791 RepID=A0A9E4NL00_9GAMM|nr:type II toxin-antitoxin system RelE/ParE family toxin [Candidatus Thiodiazotropha taylori]MCW4236950.1 type II toxin-antitoxin system RelE/ParE family toxin [Candidatus Thiodiazotropha endolucinida]
MAKPLRLVWSDAALEDIDEIAEYIHRDSPHYAQRVVEALIAATDLLPGQPHLGRVVPELRQQNIRECFIYSYRLIYEIHSAELHILAVIHGKRLLESVEDRFPDDTS